MSSLTSWSSSRRTESPARTSRMVPDNLNQQEEKDGDIGQRSRPRQSLEDDLERQEQEHQQQDVQVSDTASHMDAAALLPPPPLTVDPSLELTEEKRSLLCNSSSSGGVTMSLEDKEKEERIEQAIKDKKGSTSSTSTSKGNERAWTTSRRLRRILRASTLAAANQHNSDSEDGDEEPVVPRGPRWRRATTASVDGGVSKASGGSSGGRSIPRGRRTKATIDTTSAMQHEQPRENHNNVPGITTPTITSPKSKKKKKKKVKKSGSTGISKRARDLSPTTATTTSSATSSNKNNKKNDNSPVQNESEVPEYPTATTTSTLPLLLPTMPETDISESATRSTTTTTLTMTSHVEEEAGSIGNSGTDYYISLEATDDAPTTMDGTAGPMSPQSSTKSPTVIPATAASSTSSSNCLSPPMSDTAPDPTPGDDEKNTSTMRSPRSVMALHPTEPGQDGMEQQQNDDKEHNDNETGRRETENNEKCSNDPNSGAMQFLITQPKSFLSPPPSVHNEDQEKKDNENARLVQRDNGEEKIVEKGKGEESEWDDEHSFAADFGDFDIDDSATTPATTKTKPTSWTVVQRQDSAQNMPRNDSAAIFSTTRCFASPPPPYTHKSPGDWPRRKTFKVSSRLETDEHDHHDAPVSPFASPTTLSSTTTSFSFSKLFSSAYLVQQQEEQQQEQEQPDPSNLLVTPPPPPPPTLCEAEEETQYDYVRQPPLRSLETEPLVAETTTSTFDEDLPNEQDRDQNQNIHEEKDLPVVFPLGTHVLTREGVLDAPLAPPVQDGDVNNNQVSDSLMSSASTLSMSFQEDEEWDKDENDSQNGNKVVTANKKLQDVTPVGSHPNKQDKGGAINESLLSELLAALQQISDKQDSKLSTSAATVTNNMDQPQSPSQTPNLPRTNNSNDKEKEQEEEKDPQSTTKAETAMTTNSVAADKESSVCQDDKEEEESRNFVDNAKGIHYQNAAVAQSAKEDEPKAVVEPFSKKIARRLNNNKQHKKKNKKGQQSNLDDRQSKSAKAAKGKGGGKPQEQPKESQKTKNAAEPPLVLVDVALGKEQESSLLPADLSDVSNGRSESVVAEVISLRRKVDRLQRKVDRLHANMHETEQKYQAEFDELKSTMEDQDSLLDRQSQQIQILYAKNTTLEEHLKQTTATLARLEEEEKQQDEPATPSRTHSPDRRPAAPLRRSSDSEKNRNRLAHHLPPSTPVPMSHYRSNNEMVVPTSSQLSPKAQQRPGKATTISAIAASAAASLSPNASDNTSASGRSITSTNSSAPSSPSGRRNPIAKLLGFSFSEQSSDDGDHLLPCFMDDSSSTEQEHSGTLNKSLSDQAFKPPRRGRRGKNRGKKEIDIENGDNTKDNNNNIVTDKHSHPQLIVLHEENNPDSISSSHPSDNIVPGMETSNKNNPINNDENNRSDEACRETKEVV